MNFYCKEKNQSKDERESILVGWREVFKHASFLVLKNVECCQ